MWGGGGGGLCLFMLERLPAVNGLIALFCALELEIDNYSVEESNLAVEKE